MTTKDFTAHKADIAEKEARILKQNRLLREKIGYSSKVDGSGNKKQDKGSGAGNESGDMMRCALAAGKPIFRGESFRCSRRVLPLLVKQLDKKGAHDVLWDYVSLGWP